MHTLRLEYNHCHEKRPKFLSHPAVQIVANQVRQQLIGPGEYAMPFAILSEISRLKINGVDLKLEIAIDQVFHDEQGDEVLGLCEFDPELADTAMLCVSSASEFASDELVLSTMAHELGHAVFDAPGWIVNAANRGPELFDGDDFDCRRVYRSMTPDSDHLSNTVTKSKVPQDVYFAELRANEFMGSLLVPRQHLRAAVEELAPQYAVAVTMHRNPCVEPDMHSSDIELSPQGATGHILMEDLQRSIAKRFGVNRRFIEVRMQRYGFLK